MEHAPSVKARDMRTVKHVTNVLERNLVPSKCPTHALLVKCSEVDRCQLSRARLWTYIDAATSKQSSNRDIDVLSLHVTVEGVGQQGATFPEGIGTTEQG